MTSRRGTNVDYSTFAAGGDGESDYEDTPTVDFTSLYSELLRWKNYRQGAVKRAAPTAFTADWLRKNGAFRPTIFPAVPHDMYLRLPSGAESRTLEVLTQAVGQAKQIETFDVPSQTESSNKWTMYQWCMYWAQRTGQGGLLLDAKSPHGGGGELKGVSIADVKRLTALPGVHVAGLEKHITVPHPIAAVDLAGSTSPQSTYVAMYPSGTIINFHMAPCGASLWIWLHKGAVTLSLIPPTPGNLTAYATWARDGQRNAGANLAASCEGVARADLTAGDMLILPPGWCYALLSTDNSVAVAGTLLRADSMALHVEALRIEEYLSMPSPSTPAVALHRQKTKMLLWQVAARYAQSLETKVAQREPAFWEQVTTRAAEMEKEDRATAAVKRAALARQMAAASTRAPGQLGRSGHDAGGSRHQRPPEGRDGAKRRRRDSLAFLASDSEGQSGSEEDEKEWRPEGQGIGSLDSVSDLDFDEGSDDGSESFDSDEEEGETLRQRKGQRKRQAAKMQQPLVNIGTSTRFKGRMPARLAAVLHENDEEEGMIDEFEWGEKEKGISERVPGNVVAPSPTPLKLKIKLNTGGTTGATIASTTAAAPSKLKLKLKAPAAPQNNMETCWAGAVPEELSEGEEQGLAALIIALREWLCTPDGLECVPSSVPAPWEVVARLELGMKRLGLSLEVPIKADLGPEPSFGGASPIAEPLISPKQSEGEEEGGETAPEDASAGNRGAVIEESAGPKPRPPVQRATPASAGGTKRGVKKLSTKDRLKKKLGL